MLYEWWIERNLEGSNRHFYIGTRPTSASRNYNHKILQPQEKDPEDGGSGLARNGGTSLSNYTV